MRVSHYILERLAPHGLVALVFLHRPCAMSRRLITELGFVFVLAITSKAACDRPGSRVSGASIHW